MQRSGTAGLLLVAAALTIGGCTGITMHSTASNADCARLETLSGGGNPADVVPDLELPMPKEIERPAATVVKRGEAGTIRPTETTIGTPDSLADKLIVVAELTGDLETARREVRASIQSQGLRLEGATSEESNDVLQNFSQGYSGDLRSGAVATHRCEDVTWLVVSELLAPRFPETVDDPLPGCESVLAKFPSGIYGDPMLIDGSSEETDDEEGSKRICGVKNRDNYSLSGVTYIHMYRPALDPRRWTGRLQDLAKDPEDFASHCVGDDIGRASRPLPDGPPGAMHCLQAPGSRAEVHAALVVGDDYWIGVKHEGEAASAWRVRSAASKILESLSGR